MSGDPGARLARHIATAARRPGARRTLLLDVDGTLAPLAPSPTLARVLPGIPALLETLAEQGWSVVLVSGRPRAEVKRLCPARGIAIFGSHGLEGPGFRPAVATDGALRRRLLAVARNGRTLARAAPGVRVERKPWGVAFHDRRLSRGDAAVWRRRVRALLAESDLRGLEILRGSRVVEVRPQGAHKGIVLSTMFPQGLGRRRDPSLVAVGDDRTDEDLFRAVRRVGLPVHVGRPRRKTEAARRLPSPRAVRRFLAVLVEEGRP